MDQNLLIALAIVVLLLVVAAIVLTRRRRTEHLAHRFGPEYERTVESMGSRPKAEAELAKRERRVRKFHIVPLAPDDAARFQREWQALQGRFVDSPRSAVADADVLVRDLMTRRGYPMGDFDSLAADLSVDHPGVVEHYRAAHAIALLDRQGESDTESLRQALVHYRALFADLLEVGDAREQRARAEERREEPRRGSLLRPDRAMAREEAEARQRRGER